MPNVPAIDHIVFFTPDSVEIWARANLAYVQNKGWGCVAHWGDNPEMSVMVPAAMIIAKDTEWCARGAGCQFCYEQFLQRARAAFRIPHWEEFHDPFFDDVRYG